MIGATLFATNHQSFTSLISQIYLIICMKEGVCVEGGEETTTAIFFARVIPFSAINF